MCGDVHDTALRTLFLQDVQARFRSHKKLAPGDRSRYRLNLVEHMWSLCIRNAQNQTRPRVVRLPGVALRVDTRARSIGYGEGIDKVRRAVIQGMKRQTVQDVVGNEAEAGA